MFDTIIDRFGRLDYACNVAGLCITGESVSTTTEAWDKLFQTNSRGTWLCQKYEIIQMQKQQPLESPDSRQKGRGSIVNVSSMAGCQGQPNLVAYGASKHSVIGFTKADGMRYGRDGIRINAVCPGAIKTPMLGLFSNDRVGRHLDMLALGREGEPEEVAECVAWLVSHRASYVTATTLSVHGGKKLLCLCLQDLFSFVDFRDRNVGRLTRGLVIATKHAHVISDTIKQCKTRMLFGLWLCTTLYSSRRA